MNMLKKIFFCTALALAIPFLGNAQPQSPVVDTADLVSSPEAVEALNKLPEAYVAAFKLPSETYRAGEEMKGSFVIQNVKSFDIPELYYSVSLVGDYQKNGQPDVSYDTKTFAPIYIKSKEMKAVEFAYKIPAAAEGDDFGIQIKLALKNGLVIAQADDRISVEGGKGFLTLKDARLISAGDPFSLQSGPTIYEGEKAVFETTLANTTKGDVVLKPKITVHPMSIAQTALSESFGLEVAIKKGETKKISVELPVFEYKPGVYEAVVDLQDADGISRAPAFAVRYIVGGDIVNIQSITSNVSAVEKDGAFSVDLVYTGNPGDISDPTLQPKENINTVDVKVFNERDAVVAQISKEIDFNKSGSASLALIALEKGEALRAVTTVSKNGAVVKTYETNFSENYAVAKETAKNSPLPVATDMLTWYIVGGIAGLILIVVIALMLKKKKESVITMSLFLLVAAAALFGGAKEADAFTVTGGSRAASTINWGTGIAITAVTPAERTILTPGAPFNVSFKVSALACGNSPFQRIDYTVIYGDGINAPRHSDFEINDLRDISGIIKTTEITNIPTSLKPPLTFTASQDYGAVEKIYISINNSIKNTVTGGWDVWTTQTGYQTVQIGGYVPEVTINATPTEVSYGGQSTLNWTATYKPFQCWLNVINPANNTNYYLYSDTSVKSVQVSNIQQSSAYSIQCQNKIGHSVWKSATVSVPPPPSNLSGSCAVSGTTANLSWALPAGYTKTYLSVPLKGITDQLITDTTQYSLTGLDSNIVYSWTVKTAGKTIVGAQSVPVGQTIQCKVPDPVNPVEQPTATLTANPTSIASGQTSMLTWTTKNSSSCAVRNVTDNAPLATSLGGGSTASSYSVSTGVLTANKTYSVTCTSSTGATASDSATVTVTTPPDPATTLKCHPELPDNTRVTQVQVGQPVKWVAEGGSAPYLWSIPGQTVSSSGSSVTVVYTTVGQKKASVTVPSGAQAVCTAGASPNEKGFLRVSIDQGYKEF